MQAVSYLRALPDCSFEVQQRAFLAECAVAGLEVGPTFTETAPASVGPSPPRAPEFRHMLRTLLADQRGFAVVVVADLRVLGDSAHEQARRYLQLEALGLPLRLAGGGDVDAAVIAAWAARGGTERRREQVLAGMRERALHGEVLGRAPYGYRVVDRHLRVQPDEAAVVRDIFDRCLDGGAGVRVIARALNEAGLRTRRGGAWSMVSVRGVLRNPVYTGTYRRLGVLVPGEHEPLVTRERFAAVQERLTARRTSFAPQQRGEYLLAGLATCGYCGNHLIGVRRASRARTTDAATRPAHTYYQCESRTNQSRCEYHTRHAEELEAAVRAQLVQPAADLAPAEPASAAPAAADGGLDAHREGLRRRIDALLERRASGEWTADRLRQEAGALALADLEAEEQADVAARRRADVLDIAHHQRTQAIARARLVRLWDVLPFAERRRLLRAVVAAIVVTDEAVVVTPAS
jgi:site-specific DNA recombinase